MERLLRRLSLSKAVPSFFQLLLIATFFIMLSKPNKFKSLMFRWLNYKPRIELATLPTELLLIILDMVIEEDII
jgi:hypothetical protein